MTIIGSNAGKSVAAAVIPITTDTTAGNSMVPLSTFSRSAISTTPLTVNHQLQFPSVTISFNLAPGVSLATRLR